MNEHLKAKYALPQATLFGADIATEAVGATMSGYLASDGGIPLQSAIPLSAAARAAPTAKTTTH